MKRTNHYAGVYLIEMQAGRDPDMVNELIYTVAQKDQRIPAEHIPYLLNVATDDELLRPYVVKVSGDAITEFAKLKKQWRWVLPITKYIDDYVRDTDREMSEIDALMIGEYNQNYVYIDNEPSPSLREQLSIPRYTLTFPLSLPLTRKMMDTWQKYKTANAYSFRFPYLCSLNLIDDDYGIWQQRILAKERLFYWSYQEKKIRASIEDLPRIIALRRQMIEDLEAVL